MVYVNFMLKFMSFSSVFVIRVFSAHFTCAVRIFIITYSMFTYTHWIRNHNYQVIFSSFNFISNKFFLSFVRWYLCTHIDWKVIIGFDWRVFFPLLFCFRLLKLLFEQNWRFFFFHSWNRWWPIWAQSFPIWMFCTLGFEEGKMFTS